MEDFTDQQIQADYKTNGHPMHFQIDQFSVSPTKSGCLIVDWTVDNDHVLADMMLRGWTIDMMREVFSFPGQGKPSRSDLKTQISIMKDVFFFDDDWTEQQSTMLEAFYEHGYDNEKIAELMDRSVDSIKKGVQANLRRLRLEYYNDGNQGDPTYHAVQRHRRAYLIRHPELQSSNSPQPTYFDWCRSRSKSKRSIR